MEKTTKAQILEVALNFFSVQGFEATSISQISDAVGIRKASLYSHFENKQSILDELVDLYWDEFNEHSIFTKADWTDPEFIADKMNMSDDDITAMLLGQMKFVINDPGVSRIRKMLAIEQYINPKLAGYLTKVSYEDVLKYNTGLVSFLIRQGRLKDMDAEIMAAQLCFPISMWMTLCDREPERQAEVLELAAKHIKQFLEVYKK